MFAATNQSKLVPIAGGALATTFGLFYLMQGLVASDDLEFQEPTRKTYTDITIEKIVEPTPREMERIPPPPKVIPEPKVELVRPPSYKGVQTEIGPAPDAQVIATGDKFIDLGMSDGERIPIVRVTPVYPRRALTDGVEGWVILEFTVSELGSVEDAVVVDANPKGYFERSALNAIAKYKYKPTVVDGQPRASKGQFRMTFEMADNG